MQMINDAYALEIAQMQKHVDYFCIMFGVDLPE